MVLFASKLMCVRAQLRPAGTCCSAATHSHSLWGLSQAAAYAQAVLLPPPQTPKPRPSRDWSGLVERLGLTEGAKFFENLYMEKT